MAALAHLGVGFASKRIAPQIPLWILLVGAYLIDLIFFVFWFAGIEDMPKPGSAPWVPWSHSLLMSAVWSILAAFIAALISRNKRTGVIMGLLVFSHWVVDFMSHPMMAAFPTDTGLPLSLKGSPMVGLGLWSTKTGIYVGEYGTLICGVLIYLWALISERRNRRMALAK